MCNRENREDLGAVYYTGASLPRSEVHYLHRLSQEQNRSMSLILEEMLLDEITSDLTLEDYNVPISKFEETKSLQILMRPVIYHAVNRYKKQYRLTTRALIHNMLHRRMFV